MRHNFVDFGICEELAYAGIYEEVSIWRLNCEVLHLVQNGSDLFVMQQTIRTRKSEPTEG
jgi:hypothetical protein